MRPFPLHRGSFAGAIRSCELLRAAGKTDVSISCTVGEHNIDRLSELLELNRKYGFASINLNPLTDTAAAPVSEEYMEAVSKRMIEYFQLARVEGVYEDRMMRKAKSFMEKRIHAYACPALGICGGGCAYASWLRNGSIWSVDDRFCIHALSSLEWLIWDLFDRL